MLEKNLNQINQAIHLAQKRMDEEARKQASAFESERQDRETGDEKNKCLLEEAMAGGLHLETIGVFWLFVGITLATTSSEIARWLTGS